MVHDLESRAEKVRVYDANGLEWKDVLKLDTETGEIIRAKRDPSGLLAIDDDGELVREWLYAPAPLMLRSWDHELI